MEFISFEELTHLFGEEIKGSYQDLYNKEYKLTQNKMNRYTLYKHNLGGSYGIVAKGLENIKEYIVSNNLKEVK